MKPTQLIHKLRHRLATPVDGASLAIFRICFGIVLIWSMLKIVVRQGQVSALDVFYRDSAWNFPYPGFEWIQPWSEPLLSLHVWCVALAGLALALGVFHRAAAIAAFAGYSCIFLWEQSTYNNHYYLICLFAFLMIWIPADRRFSLRQWWVARRGNATERNSTVPFWSVFLVRAQLFIVYFYGGLAKLETDWLSGEPLFAPAASLRSFLATNFWLPDQVLIIHVALMLAWIGLIFDLSIGFLLLIPRTRYFGILLVGIFHVTNHFMLPIGVFPFLAFTSTLIFFPPDWPLRFYRWVRRPVLSRPDMGWLIPGMFAFPFVGAALGWKLKNQTSSRDATPAAGYRASVPATVFVLLWVAVQLVFPLRHFAIEGNASWTEEGQYFAWRMMLRQKAAGFITFHVVDEAAIQKDAKGNPQVQWQEFPEDVPRIVYASIDASKYNWIGNRGLQIVFEPALGYRVLYVPHAIRQEALSEELKQVESFWEQRFDAPPLMLPTQSPEKILDVARSEVANKVSLRPDSGAQSVLEIVEGLLSTPPATATSNMMREKRQASLVDVVDYFTMNQGTSEELRTQLSAIEPFSLQGAAETTQQIYVLASFDSSAEALKSLQRLRDEDSLLVWVDFSRLRPKHWRDLPMKFVTYEGGTLPVMWNYFRELNSRQIDGLGARPIMIHQYASRIAKLWEDETGRRPKVNAYAYIMMNYRYPQLLVDPEVDLAACSYRMLGHNEWILPHQTERIGLAEQERSGRLR